MPNSIKGKNILLCVTGCVAVYKAAELLRKLIHSETTVKVVMSASALKFVQPLFFTSLGASAVYTDDDFFGDKNQVIHINLAKWCDLVFIYPATANTIAKLAHGIFDNLLLTTIAALPDKIVIVSPGMNSYMLKEPTVVENLNKLKTIEYQNGKNKYIVMTTEVGELACGDKGSGKVINPGSLIEEANKHLS